MPDPARASGRDIATANGGRSSGANEMRTPVRKPGAESTTSRRARRCGPRDRRTTADATFNGLLTPVRPLDGRAVKCRRHYTERFAYIATVTSKDRSRLLAAHCGRTGVYEKYALPVRRHANIGRCVNVIGKAVFLFENGVYSETAYFRRPALLRNKILKICFASFRKRFHDKSSSNTSAIPRIEQQLLE